MSATFEALKFLARLEAGGYLPGEEPPADGAFADATGEQFATKADIAAVRAELREGLLALENDLRKEIDVLRAEIAAVKAQQLVMKCILGFNFAVIALVLFLLVRH